MLTDCYHYLFYFTLDVLGHTSFFKLGLICNLRFITFISNNYRLRYCNYNSKIVLFYSFRYIYL